ncbi:ATP-binding cassette domain-containing protein [Streptacidiphilus sp. ASG 303]|uniref:ABC transporter ATP-binding protein n=1 Tax=Streptacidiphilus sp. ASG 303 TaxID=2896847 RepID=UPI001E52EF9D|nr:oligopeptide/dipeptide ABC transporter ATP-binding protein [Streptacidiphilus sp. ASG 303]MCD0481030.1 ATP-binding cassette domain-containing protein [Streptacidiphilus sp. ASG 303]
MIEARNITRTYRTHGAFTGPRTVHALRGVDFTLPKGGAVSFIGESGCGKTTLGKILTGLETFDGGELVVDGTELSGLSPRRRAPYFRRIQMVHQDPYSALNPTRTVGQILGDPLRMRAKETGASRREQEDRAAELLELVGLQPDGVLGKYPHQLSGGQRQRVVIARALTVDPEVLIADEAVSMIDVSMRLGILSLLRDLRERLGISLLFITHDVATARYVGEGGELHVIYRGQVIERGPTDRVIQAPVHPYTQCLLSAIPVLRGIEEPGPDRLVPLASLDERTDTPGCLFAPRCPFATDACTAERPALVRLGDGAGGADDPGGADGAAGAGDAGDHRHACLHPEARHVVAVEAAV